ncbi:ImmA/IrrE family metallo-endopeptidase [Acidovorax sacchari]|uniref:ImmA/IrrE family metallo-endopeptidase n=1 Tax=Acidovorax sacchari TaxID=3230736 RepID=UPI0039E51A69
MTPAQAAEAIIEDLGITQIAELDVEAIAYDAGVEVLYEPMTGCEATLVGVGDHAIATINPSPYRGRERFSIAHEVGHWKLHRGRSFRCRVDQLEENFVSTGSLEKEADTFASHLLMPARMFNDAIRPYGQPNFKQLGDVAAAFDTSLTATALRLVGVDTLPAIIACYTRNGLRWHAAAKHVPRRWYLKDKVDEDSFAYDLLFSGKECRALGKQSGDTWFANDDAGRYEVLEQCVPLRGEEVLVLLYLADSKMLYAGFDAGVGNRRYTEHGSYVAPRGRK